MHPANATTVTGMSMQSTDPYAELHETHTGLVTLVGDRAYKAKKPVLNDFLDFRTADKRERACVREVELNRRLSPDSYLGLAHLDDPTAGPPEPVIVMRRYRASDRLAALVTGKSLFRNTCDADIFDAIAGVLAKFHAEGERSHRIDIEGSPPAISRRWTDNLTELRRYVAIALPDEPIDRIEHLADEFIAGREALFNRRVAEGHVIDGHGDLLADDIFWVAGRPVILDCLEFDDALRYVDNVDDAAFHVMDLEFLGRADLGAQFVERYVAHSAESAPKSLWHFYIAYRAVVRAKVDCIRFSQGKSAAVTEAVRHLDIASRHLEAGAVRLALVGGNPGTGKSTVAQALAAEVQARVISTDDVRQELRMSGAIAGGSGVLDEGLYRPENVIAVYREVLDRARPLLANGQSVILDATWRHPHVRELARCLAAEQHSTLVELMCVAPQYAAGSRIRVRQSGSSEVTPDIADALAAQTREWNSACLLDTSGSVADTTADAIGAWRNTH